MKIEVNKLPENGAWFDATETAKKLKLEYPHCKFKDSVEQHLFINKVSGDLLARGTVRTQVHIECSRCLIDYLFPVDLKNFTFCEPLGNSLIIDLTESVAEDIILTLPSKPLCRKECRGLCIVCGHNLNIEQCDCKKQSKNLGLAELDKLKFDK